MTKPVKIPKVRRCWTMRDGTKIPIYKMSNSHLVKIIKKLRHSALDCYNRSVDSTYCFGIYLYGEMSVTNLEENIMPLKKNWPSNDYLPEIYDDLMLDAERRGLIVE